MIFPAVFGIDDLIAWAVMMAISVTLMAISYALTPKPKKQKPPASKDLENPTAEAGRPVPVCFGTMTVKGGNILWYGEKGKRDSETSI